MGLVRKNTLRQLKMVDDLMNKELGKFDIGEDTTRDYPPEIVDNHSKVLDQEFDDYSDATNAIFGQHGMGMVDPYSGDVTHDGKYANILSCNNPLDSNGLVSFEDFGLLSWFGGNTWQNRQPKIVQKFDQPDKDLFENRTIKKFKDFDNLNS